MSNECKTVKYIILKNSNHFPMTMQSPNSSKLWKTVRTIVVVMLVSTHRLTFLYTSRKTTFGEVCPSFLLCIPEVNQYKYPARDHQ